MQLTIHERLLLAMILASHKFHDLPTGVKAFDFIKSIMPTEDEVSDHKIKFTEDGRVEFNVKEGTEPRSFEFPEGLVDLPTIVEETYKEKGILASEAVLIDTLLGKLKKLDK